MSRERENECALRGDNDGLLHSFGVVTAETQKHMRTFVFILNLSVVTLNWLLYLKNEFIFDNRNHASKQRRRNYIRDQNYLLKHVKEKEVESRCV